MKKNILILLFFIFCGSINAQGVLVDISNHSGVIDHLGDGPGIVNNRRYSIFANTTSGQKIELVRCGNGFCNDNISDLTLVNGLYPLEAPVSSFEIRITTESLFHIVDGNSIPEDVVEEETINISSGRCWLEQSTGFVFETQTTTNIISSEEGGGTPPQVNYFHFIVNFDFEIIPVIEIEKQTGAESGLASNDHVINVFATNATDDFLNDTYQWQFQVANVAPNNNNWTDVPNVSNGPDLSIIPNTLPGASAVGRRLFFRVAPCERNDFASDFLFYNVVESVPNIIDFEDIQTSCHDSSDGGIRIFFDRQLRSGTNEKISLSAVDLITGESEDTEEDITQFEVENGRFVYEFGNLSPHTYRLDIIGTEDGLINFSGDIRHTANFEVTPPTAVGFTISNIANVRCNDGDDDPNNNFDGEFRIDATGGSPGTYFYLIQSSNGNLEVNPTTGEFSDGVRHRIRDLGPGDYSVRVWKEVNGTLCDAMNGSNIKTIDVNITEPDKTLTVELVDEVQPSRFGFNDGSLKVKMTGGTILSDNRYVYLWKDADGNNIFTTTREYVEEDNSFIVTLNNVPGGVYSLRVSDRNSISAFFVEGCIIENQLFTLNQPEPLLVTLEETESILCNSESDPNFERVNVFDNGEITATVTGGVPFENGDIYYEDENDTVGTSMTQPYVYFWKKLNPETNGYEELSEETEVLSGISAGVYTLNVEDKNGIQLAVYTTNTEGETEIELEDVEFNLTEPKAIVIGVAKENVYCFGGSDGSITLNITGGTEAYTIEWDNNLGDAVALTGLLPDIYGVTVTDNNGCTAYRSIVIAEPEELVVSYPNSEQPTAFGLSNGSIEAKVIGGRSFVNGSYRFEWTNEAGNVLNSQVTTEVNPTDDGNEFFLILNDIPAGTYFLTITDANFESATDKEGCGAIQLSFPLEEPEPLEVVIEEQIAISCNQENEYGNPFSDGALVANVTGGVPFTDGGPQYRYVWKRQNDDTGEWEVLNTQIERISTNLDAGNYAVNIEDANGIILGNYVSNQLVNAIDSTFVFNDPELLQLDFSKRDVFCNQGSDGTAEAVITGGTAPYTIVWNTGATTISINTLPAGTYEAIVTDSRGCTVIEEIEIEEPLTPININYNAFGRPSTIGAPDAFIEAQITGGTALDDGSYVFEWQNLNGDDLNAQTEVSFVTVSGENVYQIRLNNITAGRYFLTIKDKNFEIAGTNNGCTIILDEFVIHEPIEAVLEVETPISCNQANEFVDPFSDGALIATVEGGLPFTEGLPYKYIWKKQNEAGEWIILEGQDTEIATGLSAGNYALNVEDSLGDVIGIYESELLIEATDSTFVFEEPDLVQVELTSTLISCGTGNDGTATVSISGGIADYEIEWSTGETTPTISNLIAGTYFVFVTDSRGCRATGQVTIDQPGGIIVDIIEQTNPTCFEGNDGIITVNVSGGTPPFTLVWDTGETIQTISDLTAGDYTLQIVDGNGCNAFVVITLEDPDEIIIDLGEDRTLCFEQVVPIDITVEDEGATYLWESDNGFSSTSPQVEITESGIYTATITSSLGCFVTDEITITISDQIIDADFLVTSQAFAGREVILVNVSEPIGEITEWTYPDEATVLEETNERLVLSFDAPGTYDVNLRSRVGDCFEDFSKNIIVEEASEFRDIGDTKGEFIEDFLVFPNPSNGEFKVKLSLSETAEIKIRIVSMLSSNLITEVEEEAAEFLIDFDISGSPSGVYILMLETPVGIEIRKIIIN